MNILPILLHPGLQLAGEGAPCAQLGCADVPNFLEQASYFVTHAKKLRRGALELHGSVEEVGGVTAAFTWPLTCSAACATLLPRADSLSCTRARGCCHARPLLFTLVNSHTAIEWLVDRGPAALLMHRCTASSLSLSSPPSTTFSIEIQIQNCLRTQAISLSYVKNVCSEGM